MGGKCSPSGGVYFEYGRSLKTHGKPNSRINLCNKNEEIIQSRWYNQDGVAMRDRDFKHQDSHDNHVFPHDHDWQWKFYKKKGIFDLLRIKDQLEVNNIDFC